MSNRTYINRRTFIKLTGLALSAVAGGCGNMFSMKKPNILFCIADDWGWPHAGAYGDPVVKTPNFDRMAMEGVLFEHAYISSPSCTPSRSSILTGQHFWRLGEGFCLHSTLDVAIPVYPLLLENAGYHTGFWRKSYGPGVFEPGGYIDKHPVGTEFDGFEDFLEKRPEGAPFCFWLGSSDPHRQYEKGSSKASGMDLNKVPVPGFLPDNEEIRSDIADYYFEVQRFDRDCGKAIQLLEQIGELDNTIFVMTGDHGMPFPRCKSNLYDMGARVPLVIRWGKNIKTERRIEDFVSLTDLAPTFLALAGVEIPRKMTGRSLLPLMHSGKQGWISKDREFVLYGKERHVPAQLAPSLDGYPCRAIRTENYIYIYNFEPQRWPAGVPEGSSHPMDKFADCDNGPTKFFIMDQHVDPKYKKYYDWCFAKRPAQELYDLTADPDQLNNLAGNPQNAEIEAELHDKLFRELKAAADPRVLGQTEIFDNIPYRTRYKLRKSTTKVIKK